MSKNFLFPRIYICHTYYHVYVSFLKEMNLPMEERGKAYLLLSTMSNDFKDIDKRILESGVFNKALWFDEKPDSYFPVLEKYKKDYGNIFSNMISRIIFTKLFGKLEAPFVPVDLKQFKDIYVFCDSDPIGYYLSTHRIKYHALEDGLDTLSDCVEAIYDNRGCFALKQFLSEKLNLIFIRDGYNKYCMDMEVNNVSIIRFPFKKYKEVSRLALASNLTAEDRKIICKVFIRNYEELLEKIASLSFRMTNILILTEPLCDLETRKRLFFDLYTKYSREGTVYFKPHPRDELDYQNEFPNVPVFDGSIPMEVFNFFKEMHFSKVVSVYTQVSDIHFADSIVRLGHDFMDRYEDPSIHRKDEMI